jgi:hypothetical protein
MTRQVEPAPYDPNAIEMIRQVATQAGALEKTHFYPMSLATHNIFPPPTSVGGAYGEERVVNFVPLGLAVGEEIGDIPIDESLDGAAKKAEIKKSRATRAQVRLPAQSLPMALKVVGLGLGQVTSMLPNRLF